MSQAPLDQGRAAGPAGPEELLARLAALGIAVTTHRHQPVFTVEEARTVRGDLPGGRSKNLFLRDKKGAMWLLAAPADRAVDLKALAPMLGARGRLSFGSDQRLMTYLGVRPGAVSPLAVINDTDRMVRVVLDRALLDHEPLNFHPLDNTMTTSIGAADFLRFLDAEGHPPIMLDLPETPGERGG
jgi:Ala-tRNA(Pro) deacylase